MPASSSTRGSSPTGGRGCTTIVDLGTWWGEHTGGLPLPLGGNAVRRDLGAATMRRPHAVLRDSIDSA